MKLNIDADIASRMIISRYVVPPWERRWLKPLFGALRIVNQRSIYVSPLWGYDDKFHNLTKASFLRGRFQNWCYSFPIQNLLKEQFSAKIISKTAQRLVDQTAPRQTLAVHVRLGDLVNNSTYRRTLGAQSAEYYSRAITYVLERKKIDTILVFSDDPENAVACIPDGIAYNMISTREGLKGVVDEFMIMRACRHFVIPNSTLSWWAAWLESHEDQIVCAPRVWAREPCVESSKICPAHWAFL